MRAVKPLVPHLDFFIDVIDQWRRLRALLLSKLHLGDVLLAGRDNPQFALSLRGG